LLLPRALAFVLFLVAAVVGLPHAVLLGGEFRINLGALRFEEALSLPRFDTRATEVNGMPIERLLRRLAVRAGCLPATLIQIDFRA
jgi:hypothetical protein